jgi:hypothetical protein
MKVVYQGRSLRRGHTPDPTVEGDAIELFANDWDDYGNKTTFGTSCRINGEIVEIGSLKLMVSGQDTTATFLDDLLKNGWTGEFPLPKAIISRFLRKSLSTSNSLDY